MVSQKRQHIVAAAWSASSIVIDYQRYGGRFQRLSLSRKMKRDLRYFLKLYKLQDGSLLLRNGNGEESCLDLSQEEGSFQPIQDLPRSLARRQPYQIIPFEDGTIAGLTSNPPHLLLWQPGTSLRLRRPPEGFTLRDIDKDHRGRLWICGGVRSDQLNSAQYRRAVATSDDDGVSWQMHPVVHGGLRVAWWSLLSEAEANYRSIDVGRSHVVLSAETNDDADTSTFLFVRDAGGRWRSGVLNHDILRAVVPMRPGELEIVSHYGQVVSITSRKKWRYRSLLPRIRTLIQDIDEPPPKDARYEILDAQAVSDGKQILAISIRVPEHERLVRYGEAVVTLSEGLGCLNLFHNRNEPEIITASCMETS
jgi:hypothetical protein